MTSSSARRACAGQPDRPVTGSFGGAGGGGVATELTRPVALLVSLLESTSPAVVTVPVLRIVPVKPAATPTTRVIALWAPGAIGPALVHVTSWPLAPQVQPGPLAETKVRAAGRVSVTVMAPLV